MIQVVIRDGQQVTSQRSQHTVGDGGQIDQEAFIQLILDVLNDGHGNRLYSLPRSESQRAIGQREIHATKRGLGAGNLISNGHRHGRRLAQADRDADDASTLRYDRRGKRECSDRLGIIVADRERGLIRLPEHGVERSTQHQPDGFRLFGNGIASDGAGDRARRSPGRNRERGSGHRIISSAASGGSGQRIRHRHRHRIAARGRHREGRRG